ncbi:MAG TPA: MoaD/ThiS family protein [Chloroflexi bacterium]|nr:MoaD/ThiS family protein [Chloroflexota bacterium]HPO59397.1 MoaD/ThiS family protein [Anaerolineaceae bacterium]
MQVRFYATFRSLAGTRQLDLPLPPGCTARQAVEEIVTRIPALRPHWLDEDGRMHAHVYALLNGAEVSTLPDGWNTPLQPEDSLDFFPPVAGG